MVEHRSSFEIVDEEVPADFNTEKVPAEFNTETEDHSPQERITGKLDSFLDGFLDGFGIVDAVPADLNTEQDPHDCKGPFPGLTRAHNGLQLQNNNYNFKSPGICQAVKRSAHSTKGVPPRRHPPFREDIVLSTQCAQMLSSEYVSTINMMEYGGKCVVLSSVYVSTINMMEYGRKCVVLNSV